VLVLGIDPGQTGGLALIHDTGVLVGAILMPLIRHTKKPTVDLTAVDAWLDDQWPDRIVIEYVHSMPAQGVASSFQFGRMFGAAEMMAPLFKAAPIYVTPQKWKKHFGLTADKKQAMEAATKMYGNKYWPLKKHEGVAEAALIATWGLTHERS